MDIGLSLPSKAFLLFFCQATPTLVLQTVQAPAF